MNHMKTDSVFKQSYLYLSYLFIKQVSFNFMKNEKYINAELLFLHGFLFLSLIFVINSNIKFSFN